MISSNFKKNILIGTFERLLPLELVAAPSADRLDACELHKKTKYLAARLMVVQSCFLEWIPELPDAFQLWTLSSIRPPCLMGIDGTRKTTQQL